MQNIGPRYDQALPLRILNSKWRESHPFVQIRKQIQEGWIICPTSHGQKVGELRWKARPLNLEAGISFWPGGKWKCYLFSRVWLFAIPWTVAHQAPLSIEFSRQEYWSGLPFPPPGNLPDPWTASWFPALQEDSLPSDPREDNGCISTQFKIIYENIWTSTQVY